MFHLNQKKMQLRTVHEKINVGKWTVGDFATYFAVSEKTFLDALKKCTGTKFKTYAEGLEKNEKLAKVIKKDTAASKKSVEVLNNVAKAPNMQTVKPEANVKTEETLPVATEAVKTNQEAEEKATESELEFELGIEIEILREEAALLAANSERIDSLLKEKDSQKRQIQTKLEEYLKKVQEAKENFCVIEGQIAQLTSEYEKTVEAYSEKTELLSQKEAELEACKTIEVYFDQTGLHVSSEEYVPAKENIGAKQLELFELEEYESCSVRDMKAIAAIFATISMLEEAGKKYAVVYDKCLDSVSKILVDSAA